jgi:hypothetical protein
MQQTRFAPPSASLQPDEITAAEARAIMDLWVQRREESDSATSAQAVSEGLNIPEESVRSLLNEVRKKGLSKRFSKKKRRLDKTVLWSALLACTLYGAFAGGMAYENSNSPRYSVRHAYSYDGYGGHWNAPAHNRAQRPLADLPQGISVEFREYVKEGSSLIGASPQAEDQILRALDQIIKPLVQAAAVGSASVDLEGASRSLRSSQSQATPGIEFYPLLISGSSDKYKIDIPVATVRHQDLEGLVAAEQERRLRVAASRIAKINRAQRATD